MSAHTRTRTRAALVGPIAAALLLVPTAFAQGDEAGTGQPGMCTGRSDASLTVVAHAYGAPKYITNVETDPDGRPTGVLILGKSPDRLYVDDFCRLWQHLPGQEYGGHDEGVPPAEGTTTAHAVGIGTLSDGTRVLVRTDVRQTEDGAFYRIRYRPLGGSGDHDDHLTVTGHEEWTAVPTEGWAPLDRLVVR